MNPKTLSWIKSTFLRLTSSTCPFGFEDDLVLDMTRLGTFSKDLQKDDYGNYFIKIGESKTVFASHLDTACRDKVVVRFKFDGDFIKTNGCSILGADDKAGVSILLWMIYNKVPGLYYFFIGEEVGCIGSGMASKLPEFKNYNKIVSFDRRGTDSVITFQSSSRTCSDEFAQELSKQLNLVEPSFFYKKDNGGIYTDSAEFTSIIPECTNVSVGYYNEHTTSEKQDIVHLSKLAEACLLVDWENLPIARDPSRIEVCDPWENRRYSNRSNACNWDKWPSLESGESDGTPYESSRENRKKKRNRRSNNRKKGFDPRTFNRFSESEDGREGQEFYDVGRGEIELINKVGFSKFIADEQKLISHHKYESLKDKFLSTNITENEIEIIREQYLDMNDPRDRDYYETLCGNLVF